jgi:hypothetical protein
MANERSGNPSGNPKKPARAGEPVERAPDGWPSWMGEADPSLAPAPPPVAPPKRVAPKPVAASRPVEKKAAPPGPAVAARPAPLPLPAPAPSAPRRWLRSLIGAFVIVLALVGGDVAARTRPEAAIRFREGVADAVGRLPASFPLVPLAAGMAFSLFGLVVWQAGRPRRPLFLPLLLLLCLASGALGLFRGGHDVDAQQSAFLFKGRVGSLENELGQLRKKLNAALSEGAKAETMKLELATMVQALEGLERKLQEQTARALEAQAERDKMAGSLQSSSIAHQAALKEKDDVLSALRKEIEDLKKKLAEKN